MTNEEEKLYDDIINLIHGKAPGEAVEILSAVVASIIINCAKDKIKVGKDFCENLMHIIHKVD